MSAPDTPAPYAPQPLDAAEGHGNPPSQAAPESTTRRGLLDKLTARLTGLYDAREARSIALTGSRRWPHNSPPAVPCNTRWGTRNFTGIASPYAKGC